MFNFIHYGNSLTFLFLAFHHLLVVTLTSAPPTNGHGSNGDVCHSHNNIGHHIPWHQRQPTVNPPIHTLFILQISTSATDFCMLPTNFRHSLHNVTGHHNQVTAMMLGTCCKNKGEAANTPVSRSQQQFNSLVNTPGSQPGAAF